VQLHAWGVITPTYRGWHSRKMPPLLAWAGEALSYVQGESPKDSAAVGRRLINSPVTSASAGGLA
jgi:hypothetical protein